MPVLAVRNELASPYARVHSSRSQQGAWRPDGDDPTVTM